jgi:tetratricopeptide (TPR) repeat protein
MASLLANPSRPERSRLFARRILLLFVSLSMGVVAAAEDELSSHLQPVFRRGVAALRAADWAAAEQAFGQVLEQGGKRIFVHHNLGIAYQEQGKHEAAVEQFRAAIRLKPEDVPPRLLLGKSLLALQRIDEAIRDLEKAVSLAPGDSTVRLQLAVAYERGGNSLGMTDQYRALREQQAEDPEYAYRLGRVYTQLAVWCVEKMKQLDPRSARVYQALGENYFAQGRLDLAEDFLHRAAEIDPHQPGVHWSLAQVQLRQGNRAEAVQAIEKELAIVPGSAMALALHRKLTTSGRP